MKSILHRRYRPSRLDHFPTKASLKKWMEDHRLKVSDHTADNIRTMERATGLHR